MGKLVLGFLTVLVMSMVTTDVSSFDCSGVVTEESHGVLNWLGMISFTVPVSTTTSGWTMVQTFDVAFTGVGVWDVMVNSDRHAEGIAQFTPRPNNIVLSAGENLSFRFRVNWFTNVTKPVVQSLTFQGIQLCR